LRSILSLTTTLILLGVVFSFLHLVIVWSGVADIVALLLLAVPIVVYISYCTQQSRVEIVRSAVRTYCGFAAVVLASVGLVYVIGT
jgi:hypothetical protein